jgi:hypothetical protein
MPAVVQAELVDCREVATLARPKTRHQNELRVSLRLTTGQWHLHEDQV